MEQAKAIFVMKWIVAEVTTLPRVKACPPPSGALWQKVL